MKLSKKIIIPILAIILVTGFFIWKTLWQPNFVYAGTIEATRIDLPSRVPTVVKEISVEEGQAVKQGEVLAKLSCEDLSLVAELARDDYDRALKLKRGGSISIESFEQAQNRKDLAETKLSWCSIISPVDGTVLTKFLEPTEWVNPGTKILTVADLSRLWAYFYVPQEVMSKLKVGQKVEGVIPELQNRKFSGQVIKINDEAEFTPKNVQTQSERTRLVFGVKVLFDNSSGALKPGMTIESSLLSE